MLPRQISDTCPYARAVIRAFRCDRSVAARKFVAQVCRDIGGSWLTIRAKDLSALPRGSMCLEDSDVVYSTAGALVNHPP